MDELLYNGKTINEQTVELILDAIEVNKAARFKFDVKDAVLEPYLDALGHVMITDERGMYKIWAEYKLKGEVLLILLS